MKITNAEIVERYVGVLTKFYLLVRHFEFPLSTIESYIPKEGNIIDLGSGFGSYDIYYALKEKKRKIIGLELESSRVYKANLAAKGINNVNFLEKDFNKNIKINEYDCIIMADILHHVSKKIQENLLVTAKKKLKTKGILLVKEINETPRWKYVYNYIQDKIMTRNDSLYFIKKQDMQAALNKLFNNVTMVELNTSPFNPIPHILYICRK